ncbi:MAG: hypothetical protein EHM23_17015 [Acidobacteria bacterium]|nr:MAG: hypothetical protein EHM23_17015 [Acidobacteriota bacterium]
MVGIGRLILLVLVAVTALGYGPQRLGFRIRTLTSGPRHHFFGYYGITPWNRSGTKLLCLETDFQDHLPNPEEAASICLVDGATGVTRVIGSTHAWNFQQGAMLHWNPLNPDDEILFNERREGQIVTAVLDVNTGHRRVISRAINAVSHNGRYALGLTYGRLTRMRPVVGYVGVTDPNPEDPHPDNDGIFLIDLKTGASNLVVSISAVYRQLVQKHPELRDRHMWFNHTVFNKDDTRFFFLARCWTEENARRRLESAMFTANLDGSDLREVVPFGRGVSHFEWRNAREIMATFRFEGKEMRHVLFTDGLADYKSIGEGFIQGDGHCSFAPDGNWLVTDRNDGGAQSKSLLIFDLKSGAGLLLGSFPMQQYLGGDLRCDLHPRWNRTGTAICFDALETDAWTRQLHVAELVFR